MSPETTLPEPARQPDRTADLSAILAERERERAGRVPGADARRLALTDYCQALFGLNEFLYVD